MLKVIVINNTKIIKFLIKILKLIIFKKFLAQSRNARPLYL